MATLTRPPAPSRHSAGAHRTLLRWLAACLLLGLLAGTGRAQSAIDQQRLDKVLAAYVVNFCTHIRWPDGDQTGDGAMTIAIESGDSFESILSQTVAGRTVHGLPLRVITGRDAAELAASELVFLRQPTEQRINAIRTAAGPRPLLVVAFEADGGGSSAGIDLLIKTDGTVGYKVAVSRLRASHLLPSAGLLRYALSGDERPGAPAKDTTP